jgi:hypothetical protein
VRESPRFLAKVRRDGDDMKMNHFMLGKRRVQFGTCLRHLSRMVWAGNII